MRFSGSGGNLAFTWSLGLPKLLAEERSKALNLVAWAALTCGLLASVFAALQVRQGLERDAVRQFAFDCDQVVLKVQERLGAYALILRGGAGLFAASTTVERDEWRAYVETLQASGAVPGVQGIGFAQVIPPDQLAAHVARIRAEGFPEYSVRPPGSRALYTAIIYLEPFRDRNLRAFGFDMYSEPVRRAAMDQARDTGAAALSGKVELVQETGTQVQAGTLMYVPVYRNGAPVDTRGQRRAALIGWTYSPYRMNDLMTGILGDWESREGKAVDLTIYDGREASPAGLLFAGKPDSTPNVNSPFYQQRTLDFNGRPWLLVFARTAAAPGIGYAPASSTLAGGLALSGLLFWLMRSVINTRVDAQRIAAELTAEIRHRDELLRESEAFKLAILDSVAAEIAVVGRDGSILAVNEPWRRFALDNGIEPGQPAPHTGVGTNYLTVCRTGIGCTSDDDPANADTGIRAVLDGRLPSFGLEYPCHSPEQQRWFTMTVMPLGHDTSVGAVITHTDITARKRDEDKLRISEERLRIITSSAQDAIIMLDESGNVTFWNEAAEQIFGYARDEVLRHNLHALLAPPSLRQAFSQAFARFQQTGRGAAVGKTVELTGLRKDGGEFPLELSLSAVQVKGAWQSIGILRDITAREQDRAELLRSNRELEQFSYSISHDMRQPLRMITSYLQLLQTSLGERLDGEQREYFNFAIDGAKRLDAMLLGLLEYSRIGRKGEPRAWVETRAVLDEALRFLGPAITEAQAAMHIEGEWPRMLASPDELLRLLQNLVGNALKFRVPGRAPEIAVSGASDGHRWRLSVADNGIGILPGQADRLFVVFQRLQSRAAYEGTGIGLALCRKIVEHHAGRVWVESAGEGQGSRFICELPLSPADSPTCPAEAGGTPAPLPIPLPISRNKI